MASYEYLFMNLEESKSIVCACISEITDGEVDPADDMNLIGKEASLDSMKLVELCLALEDKAGDLDFEFDWTSEAAMSRSAVFSVRSVLLQRNFSPNLKAKNDPDYRS